LIAKKFYSVIIEVIEERRLKWFGHLKRMRYNRIRKKKLYWSGMRRAG
jgi:hypothetical protein